jgi:hypothetical protein
MVILIGYLGTAVAVLVFAVTLIYLGVDDSSTGQWINGSIGAFLIAVR